MTMTVTQLLTLTDDAFGMITALNCAQITQPVTKIFVSNSNDWKGKYWRRNFRGKLSPTLAVWRDQQSHVFSHHCHPRQLEKVIVQLWVVFISQNLPRNTFSWQEWCRSLSQASRLSSQPQSIHSLWFCACSYLANRKRSPPFHFGNLLRARCNLSSESWENCHCSDCWCRSIVRRQERLSTAMLTKAVCSYLNFYAKKNQLLHSALFTFEQLELLWTNEQWNFFIEVFSTKEERENELFAQVGVAAMFFIALKIIFLILWDDFGKIKTFPNHWHWSDSFEVEHKLITVEPMMFTVGQVISYPDNVRYFVYSFWARWKLNKTGFRCWTVADFMHHCYATNTGLMRA